MTDANSISNRPTLTDAVASCSGYGEDWLRRRGNSWIAEGYRVQAEQFPEMATVLVVLREIGFSFQRLIGHALALTNGPGCLFEKFCE